MTRKFILLISMFTLPILSGCPSAEEGGDDVGDGDGDFADPCQPKAEVLDESACGPAPGDYVAGADDAYPACISDAGTYELVSGPPGASARIDAYESIADLLWGASAPTPEDFAMARTFYEIDEGLGSRVDRREDLHYPDIPMAEWDPGLAADKQCANTTLAAKYPERCVGPSVMRPMINQAFIDGIEGKGDPNVNAAIIKGTLLWFIYLSVHKEAFTCFQIGGGDCDAAWGYLTGGAQLDGDLLGFGKVVAEHSPNTIARIFDGLLALRCVRDLYPEDVVPAGTALPAEGQALFDAGWEQLDQALHRGLALVVRQHVASQDSCGDAAAANWALVQIVGQALQREASERDSAAASELDGLYAITEPTPEDSARVLALIDQVFPCP